MKSQRTAGPQARPMPCIAGGPHQVLLYWEKKTGKTYIDRDSGDEYDRRAEGLPKEYQSENSPLQVEIVRGKNAHDFILSANK